MKAAVFASGTGSNFEAIMNTKDLPCDIVHLVCDKEGAAVIDKAQALGVATYVFNPKQYNEKADYEAEIVEVLGKHNVEWIFLAGYMRLVGATLLEAYEGKIINIHPSLLPDFPGIDAIGQAFNAGVEDTGVTVHFIDEGMDTGPIIEQEAVPIRQDDTKETLQKRIQEVEHRLYPKVIKGLLEEA
ncbi:phosphoribosylglycinamide formyltransferase [Ralstonia pickettii]|nr:phosphoribosylglycinamide formyltransferase [Ralstonia pickettii]